MIFISQKQIVEKGQLENCKKFQERIRHYQRAHGIELSEPFITSTPMVDLTAQDSIKGDTILDQNNNGNGNTSISTNTTTVASSNGAKKTQITTDNANNSKKI